MTLRELIRRYLRAKCDEAGITMQMMYDLSDVHRTTIQRWWSGKRSPTFHTLEKLEAAINGYIEHQRSIDSDFKVMPTANFDQIFTDCANQPSEGKFLRGEINPTS